MRFEITTLRKQLDQLKAENEECIKDNEYLKTIIKDFAQKGVKRNQTLAEIKELCKKESGWVNCSNNMPTETAIFAEQILQKISEVEDD